MAETFSCDACGKTWPWSAARAGKRARCTCGQVMTVPTQPSAAAEDDDDADLYDIAADAAPTSAGSPVAGAAAATCPGCGAVLKAGAVVCVACGFDRRTGTKVGVAANTPTAKPVDDLHRKLGIAPARRQLEAEEDVHARPEPIWRKFIVPVVLIIAGVFLTLLQHSFNGRGEFGSLADAVVPTAIGIPVNLAIVIGGCLLAAMLVGFDFPDALGITSLKLAAVALAPGALGAVLGHVVGGVEGDMLGVLSGAALTFGAFMLLFRLPAQEAAMCVVVIVIVRGALDWLLFRIEGARTGSQI